MSTQFLHNDSVTTLVAIYAVIMTFLAAIPLVLKEWGEEFVSALQALSRR